MNKKKNWIKVRHKVIKNILYYPFCTAAKYMYGFKPEINKEFKKRQYMILMNHQTPFDQFFVGLTFKQPVYYVASEDLFSNGLISRLLEYAVAPIPIKKSTSDLSAIRKIVDVAKEGGTISIFPEGNRTYSGTTVDIKPAITKLIKMIGLPIAIMRLEGGFGCEPRWSNIRRKISGGRLRAYVYKILEPEDYKSMSNEEFYKVITEGLYVDDTKLGLTFDSENRAEHIERLLYYCPECRRLSKLASREEKFWCVNCGSTWAYNNDLTITQTPPPYYNTNGPVKTREDFAANTKFHNLNEWYAAQNKFISSLDPNNYLSKPAYEEEVNLFKVHIYKSKERLAKYIKFDLYGNKYVFRTSDKILYEMNFDDVKSVSVLGRNKLNIYYGEELFQVKSGRTFNAVKFMNFYYHYINLKSSEGVENEFLGL